MSCRIRRSVLLAVALGGALSACSDSPTGPARPPAPNLAREENHGTPSKPGGSFEIPYMELTIDHHAMGVMMATMCLEKAFHAELLALCRMNRENQQREIEELTAWLQAWYGLGYEPQMQPGDERMMEKMAGLSPEEFEMEFLEMFSRHHWMIIHRSIPIARDAIHEELEEFAMRVIANQYEDVQKMRTWLCDWYDKCLPVPPLPPVA